MSSCNKKYACSIFIRTITNRSLTIMQFKQTQGTNCLCFTLNFLNFSHTFYTIQLTKELLHVHTKTLNSSDCLLQTNFFQQTICSSAFVPVQIFSYSTTPSSCLFQVNIKCSNVTPDVFIFCHLPAKLFVTTCIAHQ